MSNLVKNTILASFLFAISCTPNPNRLQDNNDGDKLQPKDEGYCIIFYKIDDYALVYVDNKEIFDSREVGYTTNNDLLLDLDKYIVRPGSHEIKIEGYNAECSGCNNNRWGVTYEIFKDGEGLDYRSEDSDEHAEVGLMMTNIHSLTN